MYKLINMKFIESEKYWFNIVQTGDTSFEIVNTKRRRDQITRDGLGYTVKFFDNLSGTSKFLDSLQ